MENNDEWLTPAEAAVVLKRNVRTFANWRSRQEGPRHYKRMARVEYRRADIEEWLREQRALVERDGEENKAS
ncbi:helix-turn-helix domain-containing protein [Nocardioides rotundus]|uniref:helix-turn-helix domain-containing protein n=1 Tax=Nocardioides rotundus TaxID=1774216 RepID=UPI001CC17AE4|nr:helix-turn-helix domain-containing protein [Nocardioides rotundus]UAL29438.1 helix-turn-helix domain-containing protein [Nocardioides rotundus]